MKLTDRRLKNNNLALIMYKTDSFQGLGSCFELKLIVKQN